MKETKKARNAKERAGKCGNIEAKGGLSRRKWWWDRARFFQQLPGLPSYLLAKTCFTIHNFLTKGNMVQELH